MNIVEIPLTTMESEARACGVPLPIEQTAVWAELEATIPDRTPWRALRIEHDGTPVAFVSLFDYKTHGYHYLRATHGPVWVEQPTAEQERQMLDALAAYVRKADRKQVFVRLTVLDDAPQCHAVLSTIPYDKTVIMQLGGDQEAVISRMSKRGRRDVRKALRESPATYADETLLATQSFDEYYEVMVETAARDGFAPAPKERYENMIRVLGPEHCHVFVGRVDGRVASWYIVTTNDKRATLYFGASRSDVPNRNFVTDGLVLFEACALSERGIEALDMMGIGSDFSPSLKSLNTFKCKFSTEVHDVAPDRDLPLRRVLYASLTKAREVLHRR